MKAPLSAPRKPLPGGPKPPLPSSSDSPSGSPGDTRNAVSPSPAQDPRDPLGLAAQAPLLAAWLDADEALTSGRTVPFTVPGHKSRTDLTGAVTIGDHALYGALAPSKDADALVSAAEALAADYFGADWLRFGVGGSTQGNQALVMAIGRPGDQVIVSRTLHRSTLLGLVAAGLEPIWISPPVHIAAGVPLPMPVETVATALENHPQARGVILTDPSYTGVVSDLSSIAQVCHEAGVPLVVDAAWAAHFGSHPALPRHALACGADALVTSAHKTLPGFSQAAYVMARTTESGGFLHRDRLERAFAAGHTTSPASPILASLDAARAMLQHHGERLGDDLLALVADARDRLSGIPRLVVFGHGAGRIAPFDPAKLVLQLSGTGVHGHDLEKHLIQLGVPVEMADRDIVIPLITYSDRPRDIDRLLEGIRTGIEAHAGPARPVVPQPAWRVRAEQVMSPREAFFAAQEVVPWSESPGRICAEIIAPYPPGVPVLALGERITLDALDALTEARAEGSRIAYAADPSLGTVRVVSAHGAR